MMIAEAMHYRLAITAQFKVAIYIMMRVNES